MGILRAVLSSEIFIDVNKHLKQNGFPCCAILSADSSFSFVVGFSMIEALNEAILLFGFVHD